eukprot:4015891-Prymnesium_polylepis.1
MRPAATPPVRSIPTCATTPALASLADTVPPTPSSIGAPPPQAAAEPAAAATPPRSRQTLAAVAVAGSPWDVAVESCGEAGAGSAAADEAAAAFGTAAEWAEVAAAAATPPSAEGRAAVVQALGSRE